MIFSKSILFICRGETLQSPLHPSENFAPFKSNFENLKTKHAAENVLNLNKL
jgi:hypothetical protein